MDTFYKDRLTIPEEIWMLLMDDSFEKSESELAFIEHVKRGILSGVRVYCGRDNILGYNPKVDEFYYKNEKQSEKDERIISVRTTLKYMKPFFIMVIVFIVFKVISVYLIWNYGPEELKYTIYGDPIISIKNFMF